MALEDELLRCRPQHIGIPTVVQLVEGLGLTGVLTVEMDDQVLSEVRFSAGRPVWARCGGVDGQAAMLDTFTVDGSLVRFEARDAVPGDPLGDVLGLVMEGCRVSDDWRRIETMRVGVNGTPMPTLLGPVAKVVERLNGIATVGEAVRSAGVGRAEVVDALLDLLTAGSIELVELPADSPALIADYYEAMEVGRSYLRQGHHDAAEAAFDRALVLQPGDRLAAQNLKRVRVLRDDIQARPGALRSVP